MVMAAIRSINTVAEAMPQLTRFSLQAPKLVEVEFANGRVFKLSAEFLRINSPAVDGKIRSIGGEKVISGRRHVGIMSAEPVVNYGVGYCTEDAFFSVKEVDLALAADLGTLQRLPLIVGYGNAMELALTARQFFGSEAKQLGLVSRAFPSKDDLDQAGSCVAERDFPAALCKEKRELPNNGDFHSNQSNGIVVLNRHSSFCESGLCSRQRPLARRENNRRGARATDGGDNTCDYRLYEQGARKFEIAGIGAIECCPSNRLKNKTEYFSEANYWALKYNEDLKTLLKNWQLEKKDIRYSYFDTYAAIQDLIQSPISFGKKKENSIKPFAVLMVMAAIQSINTVAEAMPRLTRFSLQAPKLVNTSSLF
ncbi:hypothetical protein AHAS_Ahas15G0165100 [Arachis hypogaea]